MGDRNLISFDDPARHDGTAHDLGALYLDPATHWASAIKITAGVRDLTVRAAIVPGGHDACVDLNNRARDIRVIIGDAMPFGQFAVTCKGGCIRPYIEIQRLFGRSLVADVILGDWSDQSHEPVTAPVLAITRADGRPVRVLVLKSDRPHFVSGTGPYEFLFPWPWLNPAWLGYPAAFVFATLRRWGFFRAQAN
jgi:hypothetical protein